MHGSIMRNLFLTIPIFALFLCFSGLTHAQDVSSITGDVTDISGAVIPKANVTLANDLTSVSLKAVTNSVGSYTIPNIAPGPGYKITFSASGFKTVIISGIYLSESSTRTQDAKLSVGAESQTVEVSAASQNVTINTTDATVGNNFQVAELNDLPIQDRGNPTALFTQQPGVALTPGLAGAVTGARTDQSNVTVDGLEMNDNATGQFGVIIGNAPVDSVQELRGVTAGETSSSGQGAGGQFELVTKSGTNKFHGNVNEYHRDTDLEANNWFNNNSGVARPPLVRNQFGGNVGGPIWKDKAFFFFDYDGRRDAISALEDRTVPIGTDSSGYRGGQVSYINSTGAIATLSSSQVAALDPQGIGWDQALLKFFQGGYPSANDMTGDVGDLVNTAGFRFNAPTPFSVDNYVQRVDYTINDRMRVFGKGGFTVRNDEWSEIQFPGDPQTYPRYDRSYNWVIGHTWTIGQNKTNQASYGETYENLQFPVAYNPQGSYQFGFSGFPGAIPNGGGPYAAGNNAQYRTYPIPILRDDFSWEKGRHNLTFGGTFKWETPNEFANEDYYFPNVGITGNTGFTALAPNLRPQDISSDSAAVNIFDNLFSTALGAFADTSANFYYNNKAVVEPQGTGLDLNYRYYETEVYLSDSWKLTPDLTITYGLRYQNYTVPYETHGEQAITNLNNNGITSSFSWDTYWKDRETQSATGTTGNSSLPLLQFIYGGKVNNQAGYFHPDNKNFAPRFAIAYSPSYDKKSVFSLGGGVIYDHSLINALQFQQLQTSYVFEATNTSDYGIAADPKDSLASSNPAQGGLPRFTALNSPPPPPAAPTIVTPFIPYVSQGMPYGLPFSAFNLMMDTNLKTPYSIQFTAGFQHEFPQGYILKMNYVGRLGRRLLAIADAAQLLDFPDNTHGSTQTMGQAFAALTTQLRQNVKLGPLGAILAVTPQPWFEDVLTPGYGKASGFASNTQLVAYETSPYPQRGDFADTMQLISQIDFPDSILPTNAGMTSQFSSNSVWTNKGSSTYHGLLVTLHKNISNGLRFDLNYTWSHSIDNTSLIANNIASSIGFGFVCDVQRPRECRGNSDFDVASELNGNFIYALPLGRNQTFGANMPFWANEFVGGWELSGLPTWHSGNVYTAYSNAYITSFANNAPATLIGSPGTLKTKLTGGLGKPLSAYTSRTQALAAFTGPTGFNIGSRNSLYGPGYFNIDLGLGKTFAIYEDKVNLKFRCDAFNSFNHPNFNPPSIGPDGVTPSFSAVDITQAEGVAFGTITSMNGAARVLQGALRLEF